MTPLVDRGRRGASGGDDGGGGGTTQGAQSSPASGGGGATVTLVDFSIQAPASVPAGTELTVENQGDAPHTFTVERSGAFDTGRLEPGATSTVTIDEPGTYEYVCTIHPDRMTGQIEVTS